MSDLKKHYERSAERFLQTAIVIDDEANLGPSFIGQIPLVTVPPKGLLAGSKDILTPTAAHSAEQPEAQFGNALDAGILTKAFLARRMICGLYRPAPEEPAQDMVQQTIDAATAADVVVVDWFLKRGSSRPAKDIILGLLQADRVAKGRLRLIAIYTGQPGPEAIAKELLDEITEVDGSFKGEDTVLQGTGTRIVVLNKPNRNSASSGGVKEEDLPARLVGEFSKLCRGVLASFALSSAAAVRGGVHHVLALYTSVLDGAYIAHRCGIPNPEDAKAFAVDLITSELRNLIEVENVAETTLGSTVIYSWLDNQGANGHVFRAEETLVPIEQVKKFVDGGEAAVIAAKVKPVNSGTLARIFYQDASEARGGVRRLSRLSTFQREPGRARLPKGWAPLLSLGSLLQREKKEAKEALLLLCVQPRCDSIRLKGPTSFPFQTVLRVNEEGGTFNLILRDAENSEIEAWVNLKPRDALIINFNPDPARKAVFGSLDDEVKDRYLFQDAEGFDYVWLGDLKDMKAQRWAAELGSRVQSVGLDELEFLRWAGEKKLKRNWA